MQPFISLETNITDKQHCSNDSLKPPFSSILVGGATGPAPNFSLLINFLTVRKFFLEKAAAEREFSVFHSQIQ